MAASPTPPSAVVLFDGHCNLCQGLTQFLLPRDLAGHFRLGSLQSAAGLALLAQHGIRPVAAGGPDSLVLLPAGGGPPLLHSAAALGILRRLGGGWALLGHLGGVVPRAWADAAYRWIARHRYAWFGRTEACWLPRPEWAGRFLNND